MSSIAATIDAGMGRVGRNLIAFAIWSLSLLASAGLTAYLSYLANQRANVELAVQQQRLADLQRFRESGGVLDDSVRAFSDAMIDGGSLRIARQTIRSAVAKHAVDAMAIQHLLGKGETAAYMRQLNALRTIADQTDNVVSAKQVWQTAISIITARQKMIAHAETGLQST